MTSTRLPGKVLKTVLGRPLLAYLVERLRRVSQADELVIATTENRADDPIVELSRSMGTTVFRGSEPDVLGRYHGAARDVSADVVVRVTSDCPLIDPAIIDRCIRTFQENAERLAYVSNCFPPTFARGMDTEVVSFRALDTAHLEATSPSDREHVTPFIRRYPDRFPSLNVTDLEDRSWMRLTVDQKEDFELVSRLLKALVPVLPAFTYEDVLRMLAVI